MKHFLLLIFLWVTMVGGAWAQVDCSTINVTATPVKCKGEATGVAEAQVLPNATYQWSIVSLDYTYDPVFDITDPTNPKIENLVPGKYSVLIQDPFGTNCTKEVIITEPANNLSFISAPQAQAATCSGLNNGSIQASAQGGHGNYIYTINPGGSTNTDGIFTNLLSGNYTISVEDAGGCIINSGTVNVNQPVQLSVGVVQTKAVTCPGGNDGEATATASGGTGAYKYFLGDVEYTGGLLTDLPAGNHTLTVTDANGCSINQPFTITGPAAITLSSTTPTIPACFGDSNGGLSFSASGGTGPYNYTLIQNGNPISSNTLGNFTDLKAGNYSIQISDSKDCSSALFPVNLSEPPKLNLVLVSSTNANCGSSNGTADVLASGGTGAYTYSWSDGKSGPSVNGLAAGSYVVTVRDASQCEETLVVNITQPSTGLTGGITNQNNVLCRGASTGNVTVAGSGGTGTYTYTLGSVVSSSTTGAFTFSGLAAGTYSVVVKSPGYCDAQIPVTITQPAELTPTVTNLVNACGNTNSTGSVTISGTGGTPGYFFRLGNGTYTAVAAPSANYTLQSGNYTVTVRDGCNVERTVSFQIKRSQQQLGINTTKINACFGQTNGSVTVNGTNGTAPYTYSQDGLTYGSNNTFTNLAPGTYTFHVRDANGCPQSKSETITQLTDINITFSNLINEQCAGGANGSVTASASGGGGTPFTYTWNTNPVRTGQTLSNVSGGTYTVTVRSGSGCEKTAQVTISTLTDVTPPEINTAPINIPLDANCESGIMPDLTNRATDNCYVTNVIQSINAGTLLNAGTYYVDVTATDGSGNTNVNPPAVIEVIVRDLTPPQVTCPPNQQLYAAEGEFSMPASYGDPVITDNCSATFPTPIRSGIPSGMEFPIGVNTIAYEVSDEAGNTRTCSFNIVVGGSYCNSADPAVQNNPNYYRTTNSNGYWGNTGSWVNGNKPPWNIVDVDPYSNAPTGPNGAIIIPPGAVVFINGQTDLKVMVNGVATYPNLIVYGTLVVESAFVLETSRYLDVMPSGFVTSCTFSNNAKLGFRPTQGNQLAGIGNFQSWRGGQNSSLDGYCRVTLGWNEQNWDCGIPPLPVTLMSFTGVVNNNKVILDWSTASEKGFDYFTVERSADAENFVGIGRVDGVGDSEELQKYSFTDHVPLQGKSYYRLKATDIDGSIEYHKIIMVELDEFVSSSVAIYPNPLDGNIFTLKTNMKNDGPRTIRILNMVGVEVHHCIFNPGEDEFIVDKRLEAGVYMVIVQNATEKVQAKLMVR